MFRTAKGAAMPETTSEAVCSRCLTPKGVDEFATRKLRGKVHRSSYCKTCQAQFNRDYYQERRDDILKKARRQSREVREFVDQLKKNKLCVDCGISYPTYVMDFDHREGTSKVESVSRLATMASKARILEEVAKCDLVCSNCHRIRTHDRRVKIKGG
jgi:hypothetical protein